MSDHDLKFIAALTYVEALTPHAWKRLMRAFGSGEALWNASNSALTAAGASDAFIAELAQTKTRVNPDRLFEDLRNEGIRCIPLTDPDYPRLLKEITDPPYLLFYKGILPREEPHGALGVVGTRKISSYGQSVLPGIINPIARAGITIVSGLALGIDAVAHQTTLDAGGRTIAVLGSGCDHASMYPRRHIYLAEQIIARGGALVTEYPPRSLPREYHFPARNRIISGLSQATLVCEAPMKSGALITARQAVDQNRDVFAIPGAVGHPNAAGVNDLLKHGATPVTEADDILDAFALSGIITRDANHGATQKTTEQSVHMTPEEQSLATALANGAQHVDDLVRATQLTTDIVLATLMRMELAGRVRSVGAGQYALQ